VDYILRFANQGIWFLSIPALCAVLLWHSMRSKSVYYRYPLTGQLGHAGVTGGYAYKKILYTVRVLILCLLALLLLKPQLVDTSSQIKVAGIDIMLVLDISGSMQFQDFEDDKRSRVEIAKDEAIRFIGKRDNDAIGLVVFGRDALSRCPATLDKPILTACVQDLQIGTVNPEGTVLATGLLTAINRLKDSKAKSKVIILLTDGEPSDGDIDPKIPLEIAKKLGIKIYTVGIGSDTPEQFMHPFYGIVQKPCVNAQLLAHIATQTGGRFFMARSSHDMRDIYTTIDQLEKSNLQAPIFSKYYDLGVSGALGILGLLFFACGLGAYRWFGL
jgi:Ca-activated chloride channel family protein